MSEQQRVLAWVGSICGVASPQPNDDGEWNGAEVGDEEPCVLCYDERCVARVIDWQDEGDAVADRLVERLRAQRERLRAALSTLHHVGGGLATAAYNLGQPAWTWDESMRPTLADLATRWDAALLVVKRALAIDREEASAPGQLYYVRCTEGAHGDSMLWWGPGRCGYTTVLERAGLYSESEARAICRIRPPIEIAYRREDVERAAQRQVTAGTAIPAVQWEDG